MQEDAPQDLALVSWNVRSPRPWLPHWIWNMKGYAYNVTYGMDTYVYVIDNGLNPMNPVRPVAYSVQMLLTRLIGLSIGRLALWLERQC